MGAPFFYIVLFGRISEMFLRARFRVSYFVFRYRGPCLRASCLFFDFGHFFCYFVFLLKKFVFDGFLVFFGVYRPVAHIIT